MTFFKGRNRTLQTRIILESEALSINKQLSYKVERLEESLQQPILTKL